MNVMHARRALIWSIALASSVYCVRLEGADPFYESLYRRGIDAFDRGDTATAVKRLRLACFGFLDEPELLAEGLTLMALAQVGQGDRTGFVETFRRIEEIEERFGGWSKASLAPERRRAFEQAVVKTLPTATLAASSVFSYLVTKPTPTRPASAARAVPTQGASAGASGAPIPSPTQPAKPGAGSTPRPTHSPTPVPMATKAASPANGMRAPDLTTPPVAVPPIELSATDHKELDRALDLAARDKVTEAFAAARQVADRNPTVAEPQMLTAELAYRLSRWAEALSYFRRGGDPGEEQPLRLFYLAVTLYETGDLQGAATTLRRCLPSLRRTSYVDTYVAKILGPQGKR